MEIKDNDDGTYDVHYIALVPGDFSISVKHYDLGVKSEWGHIRGSPFRVFCHDPWTQHRVSGQVPRIKTNLTLNFVAGCLVLCGATETGIYLCEIQPNVKFQTKAPSKRCLGMDLVDQGHTRTSS